MKRLYSRIYVHFLGLLLLVGLSTSAVFSFGQRGVFMRDVTERMSRHLAAELGGRFHDPAARRAALLRLHQDFEIELTVRAPDGQLLAAAGRALPELNADELSQLRHGADLFQTSGYVGAASIRNEQTGEMLGVLQMAPPRRFRGSALAGMRRPLLAVAMVLGLVALGSIRLARRISRPVEVLTAASRRLGAGELSYRIPAGEYCQRPPGGLRALGIHRSRRHRLDELFELMRTWNEMADRIERLLRGQRELLANISHELRSPLTRVRVALELLPREGDSDLRLREVEADLGELERIIEDVLMTSRLEATGLPTRPTPVAVRPILQQVAERALHDPLTADKAVRLEPGPELTLSADAALLKRALFNLVENAAKYGAPPITLSATAAGNLIEIAVSDTGEGIPAAERERVFDPFYRIDKARTPGKSSAAAAGFGLGLTLARRVAEAHGGTIAIDSKEAGERGCRITLRLPLTPASMSNSNN